MKTNLLVAYNFGKIEKTISGYLYQQILNSTHMHFPGDFVQLDGVHLWDNVKVDDGCNISKSILCKNVHIKRYRTFSFHLVALT